MFGLAVGNHSLTLLLRRPIALFVLAVEPRILRRPRLVARCARGRSAVTVVAASTSSCRCGRGPFRAPLVYGQPETLGRVLVRRPRPAVPGQLSDPFGDLAASVPALVDAGDRPVRAARGPDPARVRRHGRPPAALRAADRASRSCITVLLRGVVRERRHRPLLPRCRADRLDVAGDPAAAVVDRRSSADLAERGRRASLGRATPPDAGAPADGHGRRPIGLAVVLLAPTVVAAAGPLPRRSTRAATRRGQRWLDRRAGGHGAGRGRRELVELLDAAMVRTARRGPAARLDDHRRPDPPRPGPRRPRRRDRREPRRRAPSTSSGSTATRPRTGPAATTSSSSTALEREPDPGHRPREAGAMTAADTRAPRPRRVRPGAAGARRPALVLLPGPQRGGEPRGPRRGGAGDPADPRRDVRDHRRRRRLEGRDPAIADEPGGRPPGRRPRRPPPDEPRLRRGAPVRASRPRRYELVAFTDGDRQFQVADLGRLTARLAAGRPPGRRRRLPDQARRPARPDALRPGLPAREPDLLRAQGQRRRLRLQAVPARGARGHPRRVGRGVLLGRAADQAARRRADRRRGRRAALPADGRLADRRQAVRSSCAPCATSGRSGCGCGSNRRRALRRGEPILGD